MNRALAINLPVSINFNIKLILFIAICGLLVLHIFQINALTKGFYLIRTYEKDITRLSQENKNLGVSFSQINSLNNMEKEMINLNFVKAKQIRYIHLISSLVATKSHEELAN